LRQGIPLDSWLDVAHTEATGMIRGVGLAYLPDVMRQLGKITGELVAAGGISSGLATVHGLEWLDDQQVWFWFADESPKNRLVIAVRKMMAVARRPVDVEEIYGV
jgi:hypothetical protein